MRLILPIFARAQYRTGSREGQSPPVMISGGVSPSPRGGDPEEGPLRGGVLPRGYFSWNLTVTVKTTGLGRPLRIMGS